MPDIYLALQWLKQCKVVVWIAQHIPMIDEEFSFTDVVSGKPVNEYTERITGRPCLANHPWSWDRVYQDDDLDELLDEIKRL